MFHGLLAGTNLAGDAASFVFERSETELSGVASIAQILTHERFQTAAAFALRDMDQLMDEQLSIMPAVGADNDRMTNRHCPAGVGNDLRELRGLGQLLVVGHRDARDYQDANAVNLLNAHAFGVGALARSERDSVFENVRFLSSGPLIR